MYQDVEQPDVGDGAADAGSGAATDAAAGEEGDSDERMRRKRRKKIDTISSHH